MAKRTLEENLANAKALVVKYEAAIAAEAIKNNIEAGDSVVFNYGRKDSVRSLEGTVIAAENGWVVVQEGTGIETRTLKVRIGDITSNPAADARNGAAVPALSAEEVTDAVGNNTAPAGVLDNSDPLAATVN